jgi:hypothetical protein
MSKIDTIDKIRPTARCTDILSLKNKKATNADNRTMPILFTGMAAELCRKSLFSRRIRK